MCAGPAHFTVASCRSAGRGTQAKFESGGHLVGIILDAISSLECSSLELHSEARAKGAIKFDNKSTKSGVGYGPKLELQQRLNWLVVVFTQGICLSAYI